MADNVIDRQIGMVTAYAYAVSKGYTGTEEEFAEALANVGINIEEIQDAIDTFNDTTVPQAINAIVAKGNEEVGIVNTAGAGQVQAVNNAGTDKITQIQTLAANTIQTIESKGAEQVSAITTEGTAQVSAVTSEGTTQVSAVTAEGTAQVGAVNTVGTTQVNAVNTAGTTQVGNVNTAGSTQVSAIETKGEEVLESIPDDYTDLSNEVERLEESKADTAGTYDDLKAGMAAELDSDIYAEDKVPYNFRKSGGNVTAGRRMYDKIIGGTVAWNQLVQNGNFENTSEWSATRGSITANNNECTYTISEASSASCGNRISQSARVFTQNHKYIVWYQINVPRSVYTSVEIASVLRVTKRKSISSADTNKYVNIAFVFNAETSTSQSTYFGIDYASSNGYVVGDVIKLKNICLFDLTQMFGSTIADYIYSLEQSTAGAGVAFFRSLFPKPYYEYNAGELISVKTSAHITRGFNQWDEEWERGYLGYTKNDMGEKIYGTNIISKNHIPVIPNMTYFMKYPIYETHYIWFYDMDKHGIGYGAVSASTGLFTVPSQCCYVKFATEPSYGTTYNNDICINISKPTGTPKNGDYVPYDGHSYPLDSDLELRGIPKLDSNNNLYYDGDIYEASGNVQRKYGVVDLGTLNWSFFGNVFYTNITDKVPSNDSLTEIRILCSKYETIAPFSSMRIDSDKVVYEYKSQTDKYRVCIRDDSYSDATSFKTAMSGVYLVYELETPTSETADPFVSPQVVSADGTEEYVDERAVAIPVGHETKYPVDQVAKLDSLPEDFSTLIAPVEKGYTATQNYAIGDYVIVENVLYKATAAITTGETLAVGSNVAATTIMQELLSLTA